MNTGRIIAALIGVLVLASAGCNLASSAAVTLQPTVTATEMAFQTSTAMPTQVPTDDDLGIVQSPTSMPGATSPPVIDFPVLSSSECGVQSADGDAVNVRVGPGLDQGVIGLMRSPARLVSTAASGWHEIALPGGGTAWVSAHVTVMVGPCANNPGGPIEPETFCHFYPYGVNGDNIDLAAAPRGVPVLTVPSQDFLVTARAGNWYQLLTNTGQQGWILGERGDITGNCDGLDIVATPVYPANVCTITITQATDVYAQPDFSNPIMTLRNDVVVEATARTSDGWFGFDMGAVGSGAQTLRWLPPGNSMSTSLACDTLPITN